MAGAPWSQSGFLLLFGLVGAAYAVMFQEYRMTRATSFLDPFDDIQGSDYQLARSLIAFGRGEMTGVGYGESVQKLAHLPEAHTDFLLAITAEELGFVGVITILALEALVVASAMRISYIALKKPPNALELYCLWFRGNLHWPRRY
ncbi:Cell division protein FtsW [Psychrobacter phenylpyruvicus]|uniref:Probable peptidoglycan glycosyltransferase FtsW n=1 Tax=Psychrobacter phenylpyruvicus TaxID=29432 RepID=A0A379LQ14_9GAMM|nr:Cell division protein FtsW [Psychrobacter phenylpyruvicus]